MEQVGRAGADPSAPRPDRFSSATFKQPVRCPDESLSSFQRRVNAGPLLLDEVETTGGPPLTGDLDRGLDHPGWFGDDGSIDPELSAVELAFAGLEQTLVALRTKTAHAERPRAAGITDTPTPLA